MKSLHQLGTGIAVIFFIISAVSFAHGKETGAPAAGGLLYPKDLIYKGAFALPQGDQWEYSGHALAYFPEGDPSGPDDGYPGSLYVAGHAHQKGVGVISIPKPSMSKNYQALPRAKAIRKQVDITGGHINECIYYTQDGRKEACQYREVSGLAYLDNVRKIAWTVRDWYNVSGFDMDCLGWSELDLTRAQGLWHIGKRFDSAFHNGKTCDYLLKAPKAFADKFLRGNWLISGNHRQAGAFGGSQGPTLYASAPWRQVKPPKPRAEIAAIALLYYPEIYPKCIEDPATCHYKGYRVDDAWGGGAWVEIGPKSAVLIFGRKGQGKNHYGDGRESDCSPYKGWHSGPYVPQILFYSPVQLAEVASGKTKPWKILPYRVYVPQKEIFNLRCGRFLSVAYDGERKYVYAVEAVTEGRRVVHVWGLETGK